MLGMGLGFEMPVVILTLVKIGILNYSILSKGRKYMIVINLVLGAVLTTPEVITQLIMFLPLQTLYEISIWVAWYWERQAKKREEAEAVAEGAGNA
jgi:sec-independent protein translocase protein TatC